MLRFCSVAFGLFGAVVFASGGLWALAVVATLTGAVLGFDALRLLLTRPADDAMASMRLRPMDHLRRQLDNPDPVKQGVGNLILFGFLAAAAVDQGSVPVWGLIPVVGVQMAWLTAVVIRRIRGSRKGTHQRI